MRKTNLGVTLVELLMVVAIVGILAAIAVPGYRSYMLRANRSDAKAELLAAAGALERCFTRYNDYTLKADGGSCELVLPITTEHGTYSVESDPSADPAGITATSFALRAVPQGGQTKDTGCGTLGLTSGNVKSMTGTKTVEDCWGR